MDAVDLWRRRHATLGGAAAAELGPPLTGLAAWYRADLGVTGTTNVSAWADQSGNGEDIAQGTEANQPELVDDVVNGHPVIRFTRANTDFLTRATTPALSQPYTWVAVIKRTDTATQWFVSGDALFRGMLYDSDSTLELFAGGLFDTADAVDTNFHSLIGVLDGANSEGFIDNVSAGTGDANTGALAGILIGCGPSGADPFGGDIAEVLLYDHELDTDERTELAAYIADRYGI